MFVSFLHFVLFVFSFLVSTMFCIFCFIFFHLNSSQHFGFMSKFFFLHLSVFDFSSFFSSTFLFSVCFYFVSLTFPPLSPSRSLVIHFVIFYKNEKNIFSSLFLSSFSSWRRSLTLVCDLSLLSLSLSCVAHQRVTSRDNIRTHLRVCVCERALLDGKMRDLFLFLLN